MRALVLATVPLLGLVLALSARLDPSLPVLLPWHGVTWWGGDPVVIAAGELPPGAVRRTFSFRPQRDGELRLTAMSSWVLRCGGRVLAHGPGPSGDWKRLHGVSVRAGEPCGVLVADPRLAPVLALAGAAAPAAVSIAAPGLDATPAAPVATRVRAAVGPRARRALLAVAALPLLLAGLATLARSRPLPRSPARTALLAALLAVHAVLALWNVSRYPLTAGLDAAGHLEFARLLRTTHAIPAADAGWQTYQPPLYHALGAATLGVAPGGRGLQLLSALAGVALVLLVARELGPGGWRGVALVGFCPVLLLTEPQATNEVFFAALATAVLAVAGRPGPASAGRVAGVGVLAAAALWTRYTAVFFVAAAAVAFALGGDDRRRAVRAAALFLLLALVLGAPPYLERLTQWGDPFVGNWDDRLGHGYRQDPGVRPPGWFLPTGDALTAHPFRARDGSLWDALYTSTFADGFGRFISGDDRAQHLACAALVWLALPLVVTCLCGAAATALDRAPRGRDLAGLVATTLVLAALVRYNLELPYYSTAKGVFLLGLALPAARAFERGRQALGARLGRAAAGALDAALLGYVVAAAFTFVYR